MIVRVLEIAGIAAPESLLRRLDHARAGLDGLSHHGVDLDLARHIVADGEFGRAAAALRHRGVVGDVRALEDRELQAAGKLEEGDGAMLELGADDAFGRQAQAVAVESERRFEIIDAKRDDGDASFHFSHSFLYS